MFDAVVIHEMPEILCFRTAIAREEYRVIGTGEGARCQTTRECGDWFDAVIECAGGTARAAASCCDSGKDAVRQVI